MMAVMNGLSSYIFFLSIAAAVSANVEFQGEPVDQSICMGGNAEFMCSYTGTDDIPYWVINDRLYNVVQLPRRYSYSNERLTLKNVDRGDNGTRFQCIFSTAASTVGTLHVDTVCTMSGQSDVCTNLTSSTRLTLQYHSVVIDMDNVTFSWIHDNAENEACNTYNVEVFTLREIMNNMTESTTTSIAFNSTHANGPKTRNGVDAYYKLTAACSDGGICSIEERRFYGFLANKTEDILSCLPIPIPETTCDIKLTWMNETNNESCICPVRSTYVPLSNCSRMCGTEFMFYLDDDKICFNRTTNPSIYKESVSFLCQTRIKMRDGESTRYIDTIISSYSGGAFKNSSSWMIIILAIMLIVAFIQS